MPSCGAYQIPNVINVFCLIAIIPAFVLNTEMFAKTFEKISPVAVFISSVCFGLERASLLEILSGIETCAIESA